MERRKCIPLREKAQAPYWVIAIIGHSGNGGTMETVKQQWLRGE